LLFLFLGLGLGVRILTDRLDRARVREEIVSQGGQGLDISWNVLDGNRNSRGYRVSYTNKAGKRFEATCRTGLSIGVVWETDAPPPCLSCGGADSGGEYALREVRVV